MIVSNFLAFTLTGNGRRVSIKRTAIDVVYESDEVGCFIAVRGIKDRFHVDQSFEQTIGKLVASEEKGA